MLLSVEGRNARLKGEGDHTPNGSNPARGSQHIYGNCGCAEIFALPGPSRREWLFGALFLNIGACRLDRMSKR
jgi:hypothetical protein